MTSASMRQALAASEARLNGHHGSSSTADEY